MSERLGLTLRDAGVRDPDEVTGLVLSMTDPEPGRRPADTVAWAGRLLEAVEVAQEPSRRPWWSRQHLTAVAALSAVSAVSAVAVLAGVRTPAGGGANPESVQTSRTSGTSTVSLAPPPAVTVPAISSAAGTPTAGASRAVDATGSPRGPGRGVIVTPGNGARVRQRAIFSGTSALPPGRTLVLSMRNLSYDPDTFYVEYISGWRTPSAQSTWRGTQFFGSGNASVGQPYEVRLIAVDLDDAVRAGRMPVHRRTELVTNGTLLDRVVVIRKAGLVTDVCRGG